MTRRWLNLVSVLVLGAIAAACDGPRVTAPQSAQGPTGPRIEARTAGIVIGRWWLMTGDGPEQTTVAVVDQGGYTINFTGGSLTIPAGAVDAPTIFKVVMKSQPYIAADLSASTLYGHTVSTFPVPLTLTFSSTFGSLSTVDPSHVSIFWIANGVLMERAPTTANLAARTVSASISHFSEYGTATDLDQPACGTPDNPCP